MNKVCLFLQILYNKIKIYSICLKINKEKIRRKFVCISSCTLALNVRGFSAQDRQMYILIVVLSCLETLKEQAHIHRQPSPPLPLFPTFSLFLIFRRGFHFFLSHSSSECKHTQASSSPSNLSRVETVASRWLGAVTVLCLVGSCRHLKPTGLRIV